MAVVNAVHNVSIQSSFLHLGSQTFRTALHCQFFKRSPDVRLEKAGAEFKGFCFVPEDSSLGSKQNTFQVTRERAKHLFISHHGQAVICRKDSTCVLQLLAAGRS